MKVLLGLFGSLLIPFMVLNLLGGIVSGIWLAILGRWEALGLGVAFFFTSKFLLSFALLPAVAIALPAL